MLGPTGNDELDHGTGVVFVFGSNTEGRHGKGAALEAKRKWGAVYGQARGRQGMAYAIVTKDLTKAIHPSVSKESITEQIHQLYDYARHHESCKFKVAYTMKPGLSGYTPYEMAEMFACERPPDNVHFDDKFLYQVERFLTNQGY